MADISPSERFLNLDLRGAPAPVAQAAGSEAMVATAGLAGEIPIEGVAAEAWKNLGPSASRFWNDIKRVFEDPVGTAETIGTMGEGVYYLATGQSDKPEAELAAGVGDYFVERYGGWENLKRTIANDPVGFLADVSTVATGGGALLAKLPIQAARTAGGVVKAVGRFTDPLTAPLSAAAATPLPRALVGATTGAGSEAIRIASEAARRGGEYAQTFLDNLKGRVPITELVETAKKAAAEIRVGRRQAYQAKLKELKADTQILDISKIDDAMAAAQSEGKYAGISIRTTKPAEVLKEITDKLEEFRQGDPSIYRTPAAFDALKQHVGEIMDGLKWGTPERRVAESIYGTIRKELIDQVPIYKDMMGDYERLSQKIHDLERTLKLSPGDKRAIDTQVRALTSSMRNNVQAAYGHRLKLIDELAATQAGANLPAALAGQGLQPWAPRGIVRAGLLPAILAGTANPAGAVAALGLGIPRAVGYTAYHGSRALRAAPSATNLAYQGGRLDRIREQKGQAGALARALQGN
jgi:hypothetical protein